MNNYYMWIILIWFTLQLQTCMGSLQHQDTLRELREIKYELQVKK